MSSVRARAAEVVQPRGGYVKLSDFECVELDDGLVLYETESVHASIVGMVVDYMTRFLSGTPIKEAFQISLEGASIAEKHGVKKATAIAAKLAKNIQGMDDFSIECACKLVTFDVWKRNIADAFYARGYQDTVVDTETSENIRIMIERCLTFTHEYGPVVNDGFTFEPENGTLEAYLKVITTGKGSFGGYTATVDSGDGDFLTKDTLWDFKVTKSKPNKNNILQLIMYWIMGKHSGKKIFRDISKIGMFNPRTFTVYILDVSSIPVEVIETIEQDVICY